MNTKRKERRAGRKLTAGDIQSLVVLFLVLFGFPRLMMGLLAPEAPGAYSMYGRPILPMTSINGAGAVEAARTVTLDFATYEEEKKYEYAPEFVRVTDSYVLTNPSEESVSVELAWGFDTSFYEVLPRITVDGAPFSGTVLAGRAMDWSRPKIADFQMYSDYLLETDLLAEALREAPVWDAPVKVYHFYDLSYEGEEPNPPMLGVSWKAGADTTVWARKITIDGTARGRNYLNITIDEDVWLWVIGDEPEELEAVGTRSHTIGQYSHKEVAGLRYELEVYDSTFLECLRAAAEDYAADLDAPVTPQMLVDEVLKQIADPEPGGYNSAAYYFDGLYQDRRMIYWVIPVEIRAGGSVTVSGTYEMESSHNGNNDRHGYDIATTLGSNLNFKEQRAVLVNTDPIIITELTGGQNFGFDLDAGVTEAVMDTEVERYFLDLLPNNSEG